MVKNYFEILGYDILKVDELLNDKWDQELKRRYRLFCRAIHPDKARNWDLPSHLNRKEISDYCNNLMSEVNDAYETLSNREKRNKYLTQILKSNRRFEKSLMNSIMKYAAPK